MIYIDSNVFIFAAIDRGTAGDEAGELLDLLRKDVLSACTSALTFDELLWIVRKEKGIEESVLACKSVMDIRGLKTVRADKNTVLVALDFIKNYNLKPRDALHMATMKLENINEIISNDSDFDKVKTIKRYTIKNLLINIKEKNK